MIRSRKKSKPKKMVVHEEPKADPSVLPKSKPKKMVIREEPKADPPVLPYLERSFDLSEDGASDSEKEQNDIRSEERVANLVVEKEKDSISSEKKGERGDITSGKSVVNATTIDSHISEKKQAKVLVFNEQGAAMKPWNWFLIVISFCGVAMMVRTWERYA
jgi:hypothetical protein